MSSSASKDEALPASLELLGRRHRNAHLSPKQTARLSNRLLMVAKVVRSEQLAVEIHTDLGAQYQLCTIGGFSEFLPSKKDMAADRAASNDIAKRMAESEARMVQAAQDMAKAICNQGNEATSSKPNMRALQLREKELDVKKKEIEVAQQELVANQQKKQAGAFE
ncbi:hypothetical protein PCANC_27013 [Puccinia coronata f. sp. avenae]|uniref:Uncharacterized protein n=1 Tax=Puccinia coronata f. sp. avenae TaxID=200324 RepID=A0A2N5S368_9BASI|nr:hypothetical protein PCANC_27013 [Puccinia coronata f. sp. avenae]